MDTSRKRNLIILLIAAFIYLSIQQLIGWHNMVASLFLLMGIYRYKTAKDRLGLILMGIGLFLLLFQNIFILFSLLLISFAVYYLWSRRRFSHLAFENKVGLLEGVRLEKESWTLKSIHFVNIIGEYHIDLSTAFVEEKEPILFLEGVVGNAEIWIPDDLNVVIEISTLAGEVDLLGRKEGGILSRVIWHAQGEQRESMSDEREVRILLHFLFGNVVIKKI